MWLVFFTQTDLQNKDRHVYFRVCEVKVCGLNERHLKNTSGRFVGWEEGEENADWEKIKDAFHRAGSTHHRT